MISRTEFRKQFELVVGAAMTDNQKRLEKIEKEKRQKAIDEEAAKERYRQMVRNQAEAWFQEEFFQEVAHHLANGGEEWTIRRQVAFEKTELIDLYIEVWKEVCSNLGFSFFVPEPILNGKLVYEIYFGD